MYNGGSGQALEFQRSQGRPDTDSCSLGEKNLFSSFSRKCFYFLGSVSTMVTNHIEGKIPFWKLQNSVLNAGFRYSDPNIMPGYCKCFCRRKGPPPRWNVPPRFFPDCFCYFCFFLRFCLLLQFRVLTMFLLYPSGCVDRVPMFNC